jgi:hypothetical protein
MKPEADSHRVSLLGSAVKDRALRWYQHTIHLNADRDWTFETAMIKLKRYFVKDVSSRDAAVRFDCLTQKTRMVTELKKDLECLSQQMIQTPSDYDISRRFLNALKPEISSTAVRYSVNSENSDLEAIFEMAKSVEQGMFYEEHQRNEHSSTRGAWDTSFKLGLKPKSKVKELTPGAYRKKETRPYTRGSRDMKQDGDSNKQIECYSCKQRGHYSNECPRRTRGKRAANAKPIEEEETGEAYAHAAEDELLESEEEEFFSEEENEDAPEGHEEPEYSSNDEEGLSLNNWACTARPLGRLTRREVDYVVYRGEPCPGDKARLQDWSMARGQLHPPGKETPKDSPNLLFGPGQYCMATYILDEEEPARSAKMDGQAEDQVAYRQRATKDLGPFKIGEAPKRNFRCLGVIEGYMRINGHKAHVLLDGGSTLDMVSANFVVVHKLDMFQLKTPLKLQMAMSGSRSVINYGVKAELQVGGLKEQRYFDVVNLDRYQVILGTPFLKHHGVMLNYTDHGSFKLDGRWFPVMDLEVVKPIMKGKGKAEEKAKPRAHKAKKADEMLGRMSHTKGQ